MFNGKQTYGFKYDMILCSWFHTFVEICKVFAKIFDKEIVYNM